jgi:hypothetical protein
MGSSFDGGLVEMLWELLHNYCTASSVNRKHDLCICNTKTVEREMWEHTGKKMKLGNEMVLCMKHGYKVETDAKNC